MIGLSAVYALAGLMFAAIALLSAADRTNARRWRNTAFWGLFAVSFLGGDALGDLGNGVLVLVMVAVAGLGGLGQSGLGKGSPVTTTLPEREASAARLGDRLFLPALAIPVVTLMGTLTLKGVMLHGQPLVDPKQVTQISLGLGVLVALALALPMLRPPPLAPLQEARRLADTVGWAMLLPQTLAALGAVFALTGVGKVVGDLAATYLPLGTPFAAVCAYTFGMAAFTMVMGNAFAAFPVMTAAIGLPLVVQRFGGDPTVMGAIGMLSGFCGTLLTPMAANFNIVPTALLDLDRNAVIRAQAPTAVILLIVNTGLMYVFAFHH